MEPNREFTLERQRFFQIDSCFIFIYIFWVVSYKFPSWPQTHHHGWLWMISNFLFFPPFPNAGIVGVCRHPWLQQNVSLYVCCPCTWGIAVQAQALDLHCPFSSLQKPAVTELFILPLRSISNVSSACFIAVPLAAPWGCCHRGPE